MDASWVYLSELQRLRAFSSAATAGSLSKAGEDLRLTQPAISNALGRLEASLGAQLLVRAPDGCSPTAKGAALLRRTTRFFNQLAGALAQAAPAAQNVHVGAESIAATMRKISAVQLRALLAVWRAGSFKAAADSLRISEPSLHRAARDFERNLRAPIFRKGARGIEVNAMGAEIARRLAVALLEIEAGVLEAGSPGGPALRDHIRVGVLPLSPKSIMARMSDAIVGAQQRSDAPDGAFGGRVTIEEDSFEKLVQDLRAGRIDFIFGALREPMTWSDVAQEALFDDPYAIACRHDHPLTRAGAITHGDLAACGWVLPPGDIPRRQVLDRVLASWNLSIEGVIETNSLAIILSLLTTTDRLSLLTARSVAFDQQGALAILPVIPAYLSARRVGLIYRANWLPTRFQNAALDFMRKQIAA